MRQTPYGFTTGAGGATAAALACRVRRARGVPPAPPPPPNPGPHIHNIAPRGWGSTPHTGTRPTSGQALQQAHGADDCVLYHGRRVETATGRRCVATERNRTRKRVQTGLCTAATPWNGAAQFMGHSGGTGHTRGGTRCARHPPDGRPCPRWPRSVRGVRGDAPEGGNAACAAPLSDLTTWPGPGSPKSTRRARRARRTVIAGAPGRPPESHHKWV